MLKLSMITNRVLGWVYWFMRISTGSSLIRVVYWGSYVYWRHLGSTVRGLTFAVFVHVSGTGSCVCVGVQTRVTCVASGASHSGASLSVAGCGGCSGCPYSVGKIHSSFRHPRLIYRRHKITSEDSCDAREVLRPAFIKYSRGIGEAPTFGRGRGVR